VTSSPLKDDHYNFFIHSLRKKIKADERKTKTKAIKRSSNLFFGLGPVNQSYTTKAQTTSKVMPAQNRLTNIRQPKTSNGGPNQSEK
jgi:hypothetical protein